MSTPKPGDLKPSSQRRALLDESRREDKTLLRISLSSAHTDRQLTQIRTVKDWSVYDFAVLTLRSKDGATRRVTACGILSVVFLVRLDCVHLHKGFLLNLIYICYVVLLAIVADLVAFAVDPRHGRAHRALLEGRHELPCPGQLHLALFVAVPDR